MTKENGYVHGKKSQLFLLMGICLSILVTSCNPSPAQIQNAIEQTRVFESGIETAIAKTQSVTNQESDKKPTPVAEILSAPTMKPSATAKPLPTIQPTVKPKTLELIETVYIENYCEFSISTVFFAKKILPYNTNGYYTYYETKSSNSTFLDVVLSIKNEDSTIKSAEDFISVNAYYDNKYSYGSSAISVGPDGDFQMGFYGIEPLMTREVHHLITVPVEVENSSKPLVINLKVNNQEFQFVVR